MEGSPYLRPLIEQSPLGKAFRIFQGAQMCYSKFCIFNQTLELLSCRYIMYFLERIEDKQSINIYLHIKTEKTNNQEHKVLL